MINNKQGWSLSTIGLKCKVIAGQSPKGEFYNENGEGLPFYQGKKEFGGKFINDPTTWTRSVTKKAESGDILMSVRAPVGPVNFCTQDICIGRGLAAIRARREVDKDFLFYYLLFKQDEIKGSEGAVFSSINKKQIEDIPLYYPSLSEQKRIVAILDDAFERIDTAIANTEKNLANARELFESYLNKAFEQRSEDWVEKRLDEISTFSSGGTPAKGNDNYWNGDIPWVSGRDMKSTKLSNSLLHISQAAVVESATRMVPAGTLLILVRGMGLAHGAQVTELMVPSAFNQDIKGIHTKSGVAPRYLLFALRKLINSHDNIIRSAAHGTLKIDTGELKAIMVPVPPYRHQQEVVTTIDLLTEESQHIQSIHRRKLSALAELKQSLLQKAFSGELTTDFNPDALEH